MTIFADLHDHSEDTRIGIIGRQAMDYRRVIGFIVEDDAKADRYVGKLEKLFPGITVIDRTPFQDKVLVRVGPKTGGQA